MSRFFFPLFLSISLHLLFAAVPTRADGLYNDYPSWFSPVDSGSVVFGLGHVEMQGEYQDASAVAARISGMINDRSSLRLSMLYPVIRRPDRYVHGFADLLGSSSVRIFGDTLNVNGLFLRADFRIPIGSNVLRPFSFRSSTGGIYPDAGGGIEVRKETVLFRIRGSITHTLVGQKEVEGALTNTDYSMLALLFEFDLNSRISLQTSVFARKSIHGRYRETYLFGLSRRFSQKVRIVLTGGLDSGDEDERLYDSIVSIFFSYAFPAGKKDRNEEAPLVQVPPGPSPNR
ncbi:MAG: hypothetical protein JW814_03615 [Candidatus Krumholzibacteriota bacterium]|nr:hypothetical protein [Candidatus Krumholzibacteriota bacterium]